MLATQRRDAALQRDCRRDGPIAARLPKLPPPAGETDVGGVLVPNTMLLSAAEVGYVLNQSPDK
jgi:hypothetical protein